MTFDLDMIKKVYSDFDNRVNQQESLWEDLLLIQRKFCSSIYFPSTASV